MLTAESRQTLKRITVKINLACLVPLLRKAQVVPEHNQPIHRHIQRYDQTGGEWTGI